jgi:hypothetical protein
MDATEAHTYAATSTAMASPRHEQAECGSRRMKGSKKRRRMHLRRRWTDAARLV